MSKEDTRKRLYAYLFQGLIRQDFQDAYSNLIKPHKVFHPFNKPTELISFLWDSTNHDYAHKNDCLYALINITQTDHKNRQTALDLLLMAFWPVLKDIHNRHSTALNVTCDSFSEVYWEFIKEVEGWNLDKKDMVFINIKLNTKRRVVEYLNAQKKHWELFDSVEEIWDSKERVESLKHNETHQKTMDVEDLIHDLASKGIYSQVDELILEKHIVQGVSLHEIASYLDIPYKTVAKKVERIKKKLRPFLKI